MNFLGVIKWPILVVLASILFGTGMGIIFGIQEDALKAKIADQLQYNQKLKSLSSELQETEKENLKSRAWQYMKRAHMHGAGIAALSLGLLLLLGHLNLGDRSKLVIGLLLALGGLLYPFFWLAAAYYTPAIGVSAAKEKYEILAAGGVLHVVMTFVILLAVLIKGFSSEKSAEK